MKKVYINGHIVIISEETSRYNDLTKNAKVLKAIQDYIRENGIKTVLQELEAAFNFKADFTTGDLYHLIFDSALSHGIQPNNLGCRDFVRWLCYDFEFKRIQVI